MMPLKLIERVLPWLVGSFTEDEAKLFQRNMQLAGPMSLKLPRHLKIIIFLVILVV